MKKIIKVRLYPKRDEKQKLKELQIRCSHLYNRVNYILRQKFFSSEKIQVSDGILYKIAKNLPEYKNLPSDIAQEILKKLSEDWKSFLKLKQLEKEKKLPSHIEKVSPPKYKKNRKKNLIIPMNIYIKTNRSYKLGNFSFELVVPKNISNRRLKIRAKYSIPYENVSKFGRAEIFQKGGKWWCYATVDLGSKHHEIQENHEKKRIAGIDLGIRNLITLAFETETGVEVFQFKSRELIKDYKYWNRKIAEYQSTLNKNGHCTSKRLQNLYIKRDSRLKHAINAALNFIVKICRENKIKKVYIGDLTGIREKKDFGKLNILLHNFWIRAYLIRRLKEKLEEAGIGLKPIPEWNTSSECFKCGNPVKRHYQHCVICPVCGKINADLNGSVNILKKAYQFKGLSWKIKEKIFFYPYVWVRKNTNLWQPVATGQADKPACSPLWATKSLFLQRGVV